MMKDHPVSALFPRLSGGEMADLATDIAANGLLEPITRFEGKILDGRNRYRACLRAKVEPRFEEFSGESPVGFVISKNEKRRHLSPGQRAAIAVEALPWFEQEARARLIESGKATGRGHKKVVERFPQPFEKSRDSAGKSMRVSGRYVSEAKVLQEKAPELFDQVKAGKVTLSQASRAHKKQERRQKLKATIWPEGKFRIIYADPPWSYQDVRTGGKEWGSSVERYPTMSTEAICELKNRITPLTLKDGVLFLWITVPLLSDGLRVMEAWGFEYKTHFVWDKVRGFVGHYPTCGRSVSPRVGWKDLTRHLVCPSEVGELSRSFRRV